MGITLQLQAAKQRNQTNCLMKLSGRWQKEDMQESRLELGFLHSFMNLDC